MPFKSIVVAALLSSVRASFDNIGGPYEPRTSVSDHNAIDLDQNEIERLLSNPSATTFDQAKAVYEEGGHSKTVATLTFNPPLSASVNAGTIVTGKGVDGSTVAQAKVTATASSAATSITVQYIAGDNQALTCQVGGLQPAAQNTNGCFADGTDITIPEVGSVTVSYPTTLAAAHGNARTIAGFSRDADTRFRPLTGVALFPDMQKFVNYYGTLTYGDEWVTAAFENRVTDNFSRGSADFSQYGDDGRVEAVKKGTAFMVVAMYVIRELEDAIADCAKGCDVEACNDDSVHALDEAVAFWSGSLEGTDGSGSGVLMNQLADKRCANFKTCGENADSSSGRANVNIELYKMFSIMKDQLIAEKCGDAEKTKELMVAQMSIPLIQGTLRYADILSDTNKYTEKAEAEGATFAAAVLPYVHACNENDASTIYENMRVGNGGGVKYDEVYGAFSRNFGCLGVTAAQVGAPYNAATGQFTQGGSAASSVSMIVATGLSALAAFFLF